ncbi:MAG: MamI family restriction endonuclease [Rhodospirillaceae bacterium]|nr:MamI family restriction endonuclease [Rhodospirillaceae bacterium]
MARKTGHPVPTDTRGWSQIIVSVLTGIKGIDRKKGADLEDGSDVKGANTWEAIDTPRFNGVIKAGTKASYSDNVAYLDTTPFLFFLLWDISRRGSHRCRIWVVRPKKIWNFGKCVNVGIWLGPMAQLSARISNYTHLAEKTPISSETRMEF